MDDAASALRSHDTRVTKRQPDQDRTNKHAGQHQGDGAGNKHRNKRVTIKNRGLGNIGNRAGHYQIDVFGLLNGSFEYSAAHSRLRETNLAKLMRSAL